MLTVNQYREVLLKEFYLDVDDLTIRRNQDGWRNKYSKHDEVVPFKLCSHGYGGIHIPRTRTTVPAQHLLLLLRGIEIPDNCIVDHLDGDTYNNHRSNLRVTTQAMNCRNSRKSKNNTSGHTGISWNAGANCYIVRKYLKGKRVYGGSATTLKAAIIILDKMVQESYKDGYTARHGN